MNPIDINALIRNMEDMMSRIIGDHIKIKFVPGTIDLVCADQSQIEQVLMNLVVNACDAMPHGGDIKIETKLVSLDGTLPKGGEVVRPGKYVMMSVLDTGTGMSEQVRSRLFEPFFTTKEKGKGTGLGLATSYGIVRQHEGYISVYSEPDQGSCFKVFLPFTNKEVESEKLVIDDQKFSGKETILVVDDDPVIISIIKDILEPMGYRILTASDGAEAIRISESFTEKIDLLLTDVNMPVMDGTQLASLLVEKRPGLKVILFSGYTYNLLDRNSSINEDFVFIQKPVTRQDLAMTIRKLLDR